MEKPSGITKIELTYGSALAPPGFHRVTTLGGTAADILSGVKGRTPTYLWYKEGYGDLITGFCVVTGDSVPPPGFQKLEKNVTREAETPTYLCFSTATGGATGGKRGIKDLRILYGDEAPPKDFEKIPMPLTSEGKTVFLCFKALSEKELKEEKWTPEALIEGEPVDVRDSLGRWSVGTVVAVGKSTLTIRFKGRPAKWDVTVSKESTTIAKLGTFTSASTQEKRVKPGTPWNVKREEISALMERIEESCAPEVPPEEREAFWSEELPDIVEKCLASEVPDKAVHPKINLLLQRVLSSLISELQKDTPLSEVTLSLLNKIFMGDPPCTWFYSKCGWDGTKDENGGQGGEKFAYVPTVGLKKTPAVSRFFVSNMNFFGRNKGYELLLSRLSSSSTVVSFREISTLVHIISQQFKCFTSAFVKDFVAQFQAGILSRLLFLPDEELKKEPLGLEQVVMELEGVMTPAMKAQEVDKLLEQFSVDIAKRYLLCPFLGKRLKAVSHLCAIIDSVRKGAPSKPSAFSYSSYTTPSSSSYQRNAVNGSKIIHRPEGSSRWLTREWFANWLLEAQIMEIVLGDKALQGTLKAPPPHYEVIRRCQPLMDFLIAERKFSKEHLSLLWSATESQTSVHARGMYKLLLHVALKLPWAAALQLYRLLISMPPNYDEFSIDFIKSMTLLESVRHSRQSTSGFLLEKAPEVPADTGRKLWGVDLLLKVVMDPQQLSEANRKKAKEALVDILAKPFFVDKMLEIADLCVDNVRDGRAILPSINVLEMLFQRLAAGGAGGTNLTGSLSAQETLVNHLQQRSDLIHSLVQGLCHFWVEPKEEGRRGEPQKERMEAPEEASSKSSVKLEGLRQRLRFLQYLVEHGAGHLSFSEVQLLWQTLVREEVGSPQAELFMQVLAEMAQGTVGRGALERRPCLEGDTIEKVLKELFLSPVTSIFDYRKANLKGFQCFREFFRLQNVATKKLTDTSARPWHVVEPDLEGLEALWRLCLYNESDKVFQEAAELLLICKMRVQSQADKEAVWMAFLQRCLEEVRQARESDGTLEKKKLERSLNLVFLFLSNLDTVCSELQGSSGALGPDEHMLKVIVRQSESGPVVRELKLPVKRSEDVRSLRIRLSQRLRQPPQLVRLYNYKRSRLHSPSQDHLPLEKAMVHTFVDVVLLSQPEADTAGMEVAAEADGKGWRLLGSHLLMENLTAETNFMVLLFELLTAEEGKVSEIAWKLLAVLPTFPPLVHDIQTLKGRRGSTRQAEGLSHKDWDSLLDSGSILKLFYQLKVVESCLSPRASAAFSAASGETWAESFVRFGGFAHLYRVLMDTEASSIADKALRRSALALLLRIFLKLLAETRELEAQTFIRPRQLTHRLLELLKVLTVAIEAAHDGGEENEDGSAGIESHSALFSGFSFPQVSRAFHSTEKKEEEEANAEPLVLTFQLLTRLLMASNESLEALRQGPQLEGFLIHSLLQSRERKLRGTICGYILETCRYKPSFSGEEPAGAEQVSKSASNGSLAEVFISFLSGILPLVYQYESHCEEYFALLCELLEVQEALSSQEIERLAVSLSQKIVLHPVLEASVSDSDLILRGFLQLLSKMLEVVDKNSDKEKSRCLREAIHGTGLLKELLEGCLFAIPSTSFLSGSGEDQESIPPPKCKSAECRKEAYRLLAGLCLHHEEMCTVTVVFLQGHHSLVPPIPKATKMSSTSSELGKKSKLLAGMIQKAKSETGYVGLKNLGNICYMNSILQQFYMLPRFRQEVLAAPTFLEASSSLSSNDGKGQTTDNKGGGDGEAPTASSLVKGKSSSTSSHLESSLFDTVLFQLQLLFAHLQESEKPYYNPKSFVHAIKDWDGNPTNPSLQQDASEFLTNFFQQLESQVMGSHAEDLVKNSFGGTFSNELLAGEGKYSEREEPFFFISLQVKHKASLHESLNAWIEGEMVDYTWETKDEETGEGGVRKESLPTQKRISIKELPPHLIIHLKRFEFDFDTMQQSKINDRFEFPSSINMKPYTKEGREERLKKRGKEEKESGASNAEEGKNVGEEGPGEGRGSYDGSEEEFEEESAHPPEYYEYELAGIVVHIGTANSGHYYSFVKERSGMNPGAEMGEEEETEERNGWFEFNDTIVSHFDPRRIEEECFGGPPAGRPGGAGGFSQGGGKYSDGTASSHLKLKNAFMLIYDRKPSQRKRESEDETLSKRKKPYRRSSSVLPEHRNSAAETELLIQQLLSRHRKRKRKVAVRVPLPQHILERILDENLEFWRRRNVLDRAYFDFMDALFDRAMEADWKGGEGQRTKFELGKLGVVFAYGTVPQTHDSSLLSEWVDKVQDFYLKKPAPCQWLLEYLAEEAKAEDGKGGLRQFILREEEVASKGAERLAALAMRDAREQKLLEGPGSTRSPQLKVAISALELMEESDEYAVRVGSIIGEYCARSEGSPAALLAEKPEVLNILARTLVTASKQTGGGRGGTTNVKRRVFCLHGVVKALALLLSHEYRGALTEEAASSGLPGEGSGLATGVHPSEAKLGRDDKGREEERISIAQEKEMLAKLEERADLPAWVRETRSLESLINQALWTDNIPLVKQILSLLCRLSPALQRQVKELALNSIQKLDYDRVKPFFRCLMVLLSLPPASRAVSVGEIMEPLLEVIEGQQRFFKMTETSINMLLRMVKHCPGVRSWLQDHAEWLQWADLWLTKAWNSGRASPGVTGAQLLKKSAPTSFYMHPPCPPPTAAQTNRLWQHMMGNVKALLRGLELVYAAYSSDDDPEPLLGRRICVKWQHEQWYKGSVVQYDAPMRLHHVRYDDGDFRKYKMSEKTWVFVSKEDEEAPNGAPPKAVLSLQV